MVINRLHRSLYKKKKMAGEVMRLCRWRKYPPVLVLQMGKVGSVSIYRSLKDIYPGLVVHIDRLAPDHRIDLVRRLYRHAVVLKRPVNVITPIREPIGRNVSYFFSLLHHYVGSYEKAYSMSLDELRTTFLNEHDHEYPLRWFDRNIKHTFGIDVYATPFPRSGYCLYERGHVSVLVFRSELDDEIKASCIKNFLELPSYELVRQNVGLEKHYASLYRDFLQEVTLPVAYVSKFKESRYFIHFYDAKTIDSVTERWISGIKHELSG